MPPGEQLCASCGRPLRLMRVPGQGNRWTETWNNGAIATHTPAMCRAWRCALAGGDWIAIVKVLAPANASAALTSHMADRMLDVAAGEQQ